MLLNVDVDIVCLFKARLDKGLFQY